MRGIQYLIIKRDFDGIGYYIDCVRHGIVYEFYSSRDTLSEAFNDFVENFDFSKRSV